MKILNKTTNKNVKGIYIGRPTIYGNPYILGQDGTRDEVIEKYRKYFFNRLNIDEDFKNAIYKLKGNDLICFCAPEACHGDVIIDFLMKNN